MVCFEEKLRADVVDVAEASQPGGYKWFGLQKAI